MTSSVCATFAFAIGVQKETSPIEITLENSLKRKHSNHYYISKIASRAQYVHCMQVTVIPQNGLHAGGESEESSTDVLHITKKALSNPETMFSFSVLDFT